jgi:hypothetical protein
MNKHSVELNQMSLTAIRQLFTRLEPPEVGSLNGVFRGNFVGPAWLQRLWPPLLAITGLGGWWGKIFEANGSIFNLTYRQGNYERRFPMYFVQQVSYLDGKPGLALRYQSSNPFPWPWIADELRRIDSEMVLGMTLADVTPFRRMAFPFILQSWEMIDGL